MVAKDLRAGMIVKGASKVKLIEYPGACPGNVHVHFTDGVSWCVHESTKVEVVDNDD